MKHFKIILSFDVVSTRPVDGVYVAQYVVEKAAKDLAYQVGMHSPTIATGEVAIEVIES